MNRRKMRARARKEKSRKKLISGIIVVVFILIFLIYFSLSQSNPTQRSRAAIVDHLDFFPDQSNPAFVEDCKNILEEGELSWVYHEGKEVTVDFYRDLPSLDANLIILRVHSAIMRTENGTISILGLFTSERYSDEAARKYRDDVLNDRLVKAFFSAADEEYFGIVPGFVEESMIGRFKDTVIIMMGCEGLGYDGLAYIDLAKAFINKGAKVYVSWDGPVGIDHTDRATIYLLRRLILHKQTIGKAVAETMETISKDPVYNSTLEYYPKTAEVGNYSIPNLENSLIMNVIHACTATAPITTKSLRHNSVRVL